MNQRYKKIAEKAGFMLWADEDWNPGDVVDWSMKYDQQLEKFAELIVLECAEFTHPVTRKFIFEHFEVEP